MFLLTFYRDCASVSVLVSVELKSPVVDDVMVLDFDDVTSSSPLHNGRPFSQRTTVLNTSSVTSRWRRAVGRLRFLVAGALHAASLPSIFSAALVCTGTVPDSHTHGR